MLSTLVTSVYGSDLTVPGFASDPDKYGMMDGKRGNNGAQRAARQTAKPAIISSLVGGAYAVHSSNTIITFDDDTTVVGLITGEMSQCTVTRYRVCQWVFSEQPVTEHHENQGIHTGLEEETQNRPPPPFTRQTYKPT
ncbi:hypothetical protein F2P81_001455 [Scophthalmus maximus]|uniref:Uncharacterized protein n=1 Tax=Scophthalmus maximus TaxID=52904 RepID=A0A6A4TBF2_SCOMX|nr:hypothetical protein F2P81_001455 [Scophthalmus maximus]